MTNSRKPTPPLPDTRRSAPETGGTAATVARDMRLKAALKANMARRKAQAKARSGADKASDDADNIE
ncbi:MAG: hypothetical protein ACK4RN_17350 [Pseudorhodobacter sp.]